jgi:hypothetical protein
MSSDEGSWKKCEGARHSPSRRPAEDALVTAEHDVPCWATYWCVDPGGSRHALVCRSGGGVGG